MEQSNPGREHLDACPQGSREDLSVCPQGSIEDLSVCPQGSREHLDLGGRIVLDGLREAGVHPPDDEPDVIGPVQRRALGLLAPGMGRRRANEEEGAPGRRLPLYPHGVEGEMDRLFRDGRKLRRTVRQALGHDAPIPLEKLGEELARMKSGVASKRPRPFWYPRRDYLGPQLESALGPELRPGLMPASAPGSVPAVRGLHIWALGVARLPDVRVGGAWGDMALSERVSNTSMALNCHPALALAFLLCDTPVHRDAVTVVLSPYTSLSPDEGLSLYVGRPQVAAWLVAWVYRLARQIALVHSTGPKAPAGTPRFREATPRVLSLVGFVNGTKGLGWTDRLWLWNTEHPEWEYDNVNSMSAVYYRATAARARARPC